MISAIGVNILRNAPAPEEEELEAVSPEELLEEEELEELEDVSPEELLDEVSPDELLELDDELLLEDKIFLQHGNGSQAVLGGGFSHPHPPQNCSSLQHSNPHGVQPLEEEVTPELDDELLLEEELLELDDELLEDEPPEDDELDELLEEDEV